MSGRRCPSCAEEIQDAAIKCRYCGAVAVSQEWRDFCAQYAALSQVDKQRAWNMQSPEQLVVFKEAWAALGYDKPQQAVTQHQGPPYNCRYCGGALRKKAKATSEGMGCLIAIIGLILAPVLIGIPIILIGLHFMSKREGLWRCKKCDAEFPRKIRWYQFG